MARVLKKKNIKSKKHAHSKKHVVLEESSMHPIWSGVIGFGLVTIPVQLYSPSTESTLDLDYLHKKDHAPIRYARMCTHEEVEVPYEEIVHGFKYKKGAYVILSEEDFKHANAKKTTAIDIREFVDADEIDLMYSIKPYYLVPDAKASKAYALFREALMVSGKVGIATFVLRNREHVVVVRAHGDVIMLQQLRFANEIKSSASLALPRDVKLNSKELSIAVELINKMRGHFKPERYHDTYTEDLMKVISRKSRGVVVPKGEIVKPTKASDLMASLKKSLAQSSRTRSRL